jgi:16S rRNA (cytidine1402-2'-O)-methyltransferase
MLDILGDRQASISRELTKLHEEVLFGKLSELHESVKELGEFVVVVEGNSGAQTAPERPLTRETALKALGISRNEHYDLFFKK